MEDPSMAESGGTGRPATLEDQRMWRLLLARLHPDAGGDHELFLFARAAREEARGRGHPRRRTTGEPKAQRPEEPFLRAWRGEIGFWALRNRDVLRSERPWA